ncbi:hypothetical protein OAS86_04545 [Gammaproteobacteria bacterium]|nr:hypothetical protein [Gammaproteobacteria bacterium]
MAALRALEPSAIEPRQNGSLLAALAAMRPNAINLVIGSPLMLFVPWLMRGIDITTRLVLNVDDAEHARQIKAICAGDLRYTVHAQSASDFLGDINHHQLDLAMVASDPALVPTLLGMLKDNGVLLMASAAAAGAEIDPHRYQSAALGEGADRLWLVTPKPYLAQPTRRRGGRLARHERGEPGGR